MFDELSGGAKAIIGIVALVIVLILLSIFLPFTIVGAGERGVILKFGKVQGNILGEGMHFRTPLVDDIEKVSVRVQKTNVESQAASRDLQTVKAVVAVNWHLDASKVNVIYQNIGNQDQVVDRILDPNVKEVVKAATAQRTAEELLTKRALLKDDIDKGLSVRLASYHVIVDDVSVVDLDFSAEFNAAIEAKASAEQQALKAQNDLKRIQIEAEQKVATAKAEAEAIKIQTEALSQNQNLVKLRMAEAFKTSAEKGQKIIPDKVTILGNESLQSVLLNDN